MRTLKKTLALVLVVAMMMSLCITSNAAFTDADEIEYVEAVEVMTAIGVIEGFPAGDFQPQGSLTRAQAAKIITYMLGVEKLAVVDGEVFEDVPANHWASSYIAYCVEEGIVDGYGNGKFGPEDKLTGYQWAKMLLAALGEDTSAMVGAAWQIAVAKGAAAYELFAGNEKADKTEVATREEACLYALNALMYGTEYGYAVYEWDGDVVAHYRTVVEAAHAADALGTNYTISTRPVAYNTASLLNIIHGVSYGDIRDDWGRPGYAYTDGKTFELVYWAEADAKYYTAVTECQIASDLGLKKDKTFTVYTNGYIEDNTSTYEVQLLDTVQTLGAQGTAVEVYGDEIVVVDTFLARVTDVKDATYDKAGHLKTQAKLTLEVYTTATTELNGGVEVYQLNGADNYTWSKGDMVLVNAYTTNNVAYYTGDVTVTGIANTAGKAAHIEVLQLAETKVGGQTFIWYNAAQHTIDGVNYDDAAWLKLDQAGYESADHTWYFDQYGNVIGATDLMTVYAYGILDNIQWINPVGAKGYAQATIRYMDNTTETVVVAEIDDAKLVYAGNIDYKNAVAISTNYAENAGLCASHLYRIATNPNGTVDLTHVATYDKQGAKLYNNEIDNATIKTGYAAITNGTKTVYANSNTIYLVQTMTFAGPVYEVVTGYQNMDSYTGTATVDYVNLNGDSYVDYVYVTGTADSAVALGMFYLTDDNVQIAVDDGKIYYVLNGILDGESTSITVLGGALISGSSIDDKEAEYFAANVNRMFTVKMVDGIVVKMWGPKADIADLYTETASVGYLNAGLDYIPAESATVTYDGLVLKVGNTAYYNVVGLEPVIGEWAPDLSDYNIYVIYDKTEIAGAKLAKAVYISEVGDDAEGSGVAPAPVVTGVQFIVYFYDSLNGYVEEVMYKFEAINAGVYAYGSNYNAGNILPKFGVDADSWEVSYCTPVIELEKGEIEHIYLHVYPVADAANAE